MTRKNMSPEGDNAYLDDAPFMERMLFAKRPLFLGIFVIITIYLGYHMLQMKPEGSFLRMIPTYHPYIKNYIAHQEDLKGLGNMVRICVETTEGTIFTEEYMEVLKKMTDEVFFISGVNRGALKSLWTPVTRWTEVTEEGFAGGEVIPPTYNGSQQSRITTLVGRLRKRLAAIPTQLWSLSAVRHRGYCLQIEAEPGAEPPSIGAK